MKLNCDLGESYGIWKMDVDEQIMVFIDQANIACGYHGGDPLAISSAISLAKQHSVSVGAHPSYPDLQGFGRRSMTMGDKELIACLHYQISALQGMTNIQDVTLDYVKPHGALYNDLMKNKRIRRAVMQAVAEAGKGALPLMIQAHPEFHVFVDEAQAIGIELIFEAFADRRYDRNGYLVSRNEPGSVLNVDDALQQAVTLLDQGVIVTDAKTTLCMPVDTLCVHSDSNDALVIAEQLRMAITKRTLSDSREV